VEISELAVASATSNAQLNGITNAGFSAGTASDIFGTLPPHMHGKETVVIIDPPRSGALAAASILFVWLFIY
jgi:tRNA/tmRNA/rRNA uracil-C5-methylase (TrmA/RlmC/RlmD family)